LSFVGRPTVATGFWQDQARRFGDLRQRTLQESKYTLAAGFHPDGWGVDNLKSFRQKVSDRWLLERATPAVIEEFKSIAGVCAVALGSPNTDLAWVEWLDCLRRESIDFEPGEMSVESWPRESRPAPDAEIVVEGLLGEPLDVRPDPDQQLLTFPIGEIEDACGASERACRRLADEALKSELTRLGSQTTRDASSASLNARYDAAETGPAPVPPADRSRPLTLKEAAVALRVSDDTLHRMRQRGEIAMFKAGSHWRVLASEVIRLRQQPRFKTL
jgi:excisionase family DNA binding protein